MHTVARAEANSDYCLHHLSDPELLASTRGQVGRSNQILAALLAHLAEVEARGVHRSRACSSLYTYCIYELRMSEDAALRRVHAARILRRFPTLYEQIAAGEIHLTAVLLLGPHLTEANHVEVLARAKYRTKKEVQALVRQLDPLPDVSASIAPLGPPTGHSGIREQAQSSPLSNPSAGKCLASLCGPVRELRPGERPKDWVEARTNAAFEVARDAEQGASGVLDPAESSERGALDVGVNDAFELAFCAEPGAGGVLGQPDASARGVYDFGTNGGRANASHERVAVRNDTPAGPPGPLGSLGSLGPQRYKVQFTASQEYVELLEEARDLLAHAVPSRALDEVHLRALRLLVAELKKRKYARTDKPRTPAPHRDKVSKPRGRDPVRVRCEAVRAPTEGLSELTSTTGELTLATGQTACGPTETSVARELAEYHERADGRARAANPRWRGRYIPAAVRRAVAERDGERCAYVDDDGRRCREASGLEFHHLEPHACGGPPTEANLSLRCRAHNGLAAEQDFGREFMLKKKKKALHATSG